MATLALPETLRACETHAAAPSRASWCGQLKLGTLCVPVKAYAAVATPPEIPLRQLHAACGQRIEYKKWCPTHGAVPNEEIVKGYPYQPDQYVRLSEEELTSLQPADDKTIHLEHFLDPVLLDPVLLAGRSLYLAPANPPARRPFATIHRALQHSGKWGVGRVVFSGKWQIIAVRPVDQVLLVHTLYHPAQRRALVVSEGTEVEVSQQELRPLMRIIEAANGEIPWEDYQDDYEHWLTELVETKVTAAQNPRAARSNGKHRAATAARANGSGEPATANGSARTRRRAA
jgi:DNA end-binding protein Ku